MPQELLRVFFNATLEMMAFPSSLNFLQTFHFKARAWV
jgi:hypothetical protein